MSSHFQQTSKICSLFSNLPINTFILLIFIFINILSSTDIYAQTTSLSEQEKQTIRIGFNDHDAPFSFLLANGKPTGLFIDVWQTWADINNQSVVFIPMSHGETISQLRSGEIDMQAGLFINEERLKWAEFSVAIAQVNTKLFYNGEKLEKLNLSELDGKKVGVTPSSFQENYLIKNYPDIIRIPLTQYEDYFNKLLNNDVEAVISEEPVMNARLEREGLKGTIVPSSESILSNSVHGMFNKKNGHLKSIINQGFKKIEIKTLREIEKKWIPDNFAFFKNYEIKLDNLTFEEHDWLATNVNFILGVSPSLMPLEWIDGNNQHQGISSDYVEILKKLLSVNMTPTLNKSWSEIIEGIKNKEIDIIPAIVKTEKREAFINFTKPYLTLPLVIVANKSNKSIEDINDLAGKLVAVEKNTPSVELLRNNHPNVILVLVENGFDGLELLHENEIDAFVHNLGVISYHLNSGEFNDIKVVATTDYNLEIAMGVRKGLEPLYTILDKALDNISTKEKNKIFSSWLALRIDHGTKMTTFILWSLPVIAFFLVIIILVTRANRKLSSEIIRRHEVEQKLTDEKFKAEKANLAKDNFLANMSHEIRTPMNAVLGMSQILSESGLTSKQQNHNDILYSSASALLSLLNDILDLAKVGSGKIELDIQSFDLNQIIEKIIHQQQFLLIDKDVSLNIDIEPTTQTELKGDSFRLTQIVINLINNAIKFTEQGKVNVSIKSNETKTDKIDLEFAISDTGIGMTTDEMSNLFDTYNQADSSTTRKYGGTGLGLSICKQLVELMGGTISVVSQPNKGSCFTFNVILEQSEVSIETGGKNLALNNPKIKNSTKDKVSKKDLYKTKYRSLKDKHILLVDDNPTNLIVASSHLGNVGIRLTKATNGQEAVNYVKDNDFDAILMDIQMPVMDGLDASRIIRNELKLVDLPIIALSANVMSDDEQKSLDAGMNAHLGKPIDVDLLLNTLSSFIVK